MRWQPLYCRPEWSPVELCRPSCTPLFRESGSRSTTYPPRSPPVGEKSSTNRALALLCGSASSVIITSVVCLVDITVHAPCGTSAGQEWSGGFKDSGSFVTIRFARNCSFDKLQVGGQPARIQTLLLWVGCRGSWRSTGRTHPWDGVTIWITEPLPNQTACAHISSMLISSKREGGT